MQAPGGVVTYPWKNILKPKVPTRVTFFLWAAHWRKFLQQTI